MKSVFMNLNLADFGKGLLLAVLTSVLTIVYTTVQSGSLLIDWTMVGTTALTTGLAYILKNLFTNSDGQTFKKEA
jgi:hypothetical protein